MGQIGVIIELTYTPEVAEVAFGALETPTRGRFDAGAIPGLPGVVLDESFPPTPLPGRVRRTPETAAAPFDLALEAAESTYIVRAEVDEDQVESLREEPTVIQVYSDPAIAPTLICPGSPPLGSDADVERLLCTAAMRRINMDGSGVLVAIVDTGINLAHLQAHGKNPTFDAGRSWVPRAGLVPGQMPVGHGTMCAFDVCIAAPRCTLLDVAVLASTATGPTAMSGLLSDAVRAYRHLIDIMRAPRRPGDLRSLVVSNSWGMFHPSWDFPPADPGNYSDNPNHPFNRIVGELERAGADILFAAGNCGQNCPDGRCGGVTANAIYGANGHASVLCVAGVDTTKARVGYSTVGPGRLTRNKPDISGYTHFRGSGVYAADGGTSAACPVVAGVVAAVRSKRPYDPSNAAASPATIRTLLTSTAEDLGASGYDFQHGFGVVNGCALQLRFAPPPTINLCERYPFLCGIHGWPPGIPFPRPPFPVPPLPLPLPRAPIPGLRMQAGQEASSSTRWSGESGAAEPSREGAEDSQTEAPDLVELSYLIGYAQGQQAGAGAQPGPRPQAVAGDVQHSKPCGCADT